MSFRIGPIELPFHEKLGWSNRRRLSMIPIPMGRDAGYTAGVEPTSYKIETSFYAATDAAAKLLRRQLNELVRNPWIDFVWIEFDLDGNEHDGWYLLNDINTDPLPAVFGDYPVQFNITRLGNPGSHFLGTYWTSAALTNDWSFMGQIIVTLPNGVGFGSGLKYRDGVDCTNYFIEYPTSPVFGYGQPGTNFYNGRCRIQDTVTPGEADETKWQEVYGPEHQFQGDVIFGNDLIRFKWDADTNKTNIEAYSTVSVGWLPVADDFEILVGSSHLTALYSPTITRFDWDRVEWQVGYLSRVDSTVVATYTLTRGSYFISMELRTGTGGLSKSSGLTMPGGVTISSVANSAGSAAPGSGLAVDNASNYAAGVLSNGMCCGYLFTKKGAGQPIAGTTTRLNSSVDVAASGTLYGAIFATEYPLPGTLNLGNLGYEYIAGTRQQLVLVDPTYVGPLSAVNSTDAILLEAGDYILTETGGHILLE